ncbi:hypothetical protein GCM10008905_26600 [Clostridium malenominatum]|uniref:Rhoptry protein n=1 Tax=Clostridium malenominatum TaxID=1539 RepID=A0ABN1J424_9CLOT
MAGIWNVNGVYDLNTKQIKDKISFQIGEILIGRVITADELKNEVLLRLLDGWQFPATLNKPLQFPPEGLLKFKVEGYEDGKVKLSIVVPKKNEEQLKKDSIEDILTEQNIAIDKEEYPLLEKMVKHNIPLTKDNISKISTVVNFIKRVDENPAEEEVFIKKYLDGRDIEEGSLREEKVKGILKDFFKELKGLTEKEVLTFFENDIEFTKENIKGFNKIFKEESIHKIVEHMGKVLEKEIKDNNKNEFKIAEKDIEENVEKYAIKKDVVKEEVVEKEFISLLKKEDVNNIEKGNTIIKKDLWKDVKVEINSKLEEIKEIIKYTLDEKGKIKGEVYDKVVDFIKNNIDSIKIYNTISNEYYYMDIPLKLNREDYECKLIIKDERKKGKKIDSKNVKIATSIKTVNMGIIDAFISINNNNLNIDMKCDKKWIKALDNGKSKVLQELSTMGYNILVKVEQKEEEFNIANCREFFVDNNLGSINVKV